MLERCEANGAGPHVGLRGGAGRGREEAGAKAHIAVLEQQLQPYIDRMRLRSAAHGVFVKFSSRSPKDAVVLQRDRILQLFHAALAAEAAACPGGILLKGSIEEKNARVVAMLVAGTRSLMVSDASSAIHLLRTSERI